MCQASVGKVIRVNKDTITVEYNGKTRELKSKLVSAREGDYVLFSLDIAIEKVDEEEATTILGDMK